LHIWASAAPAVCASDGGGGGNGGDWTGSKNGISTELNRQAQQSVRGSTGDFRLTWLLQVTTHAQKPGGHSRCCCASTSALLPTICFLLAATCSADDSGGCAAAVAAAVVASVRGRFAAAPAAPPAASDAQYSWLPAPDLRQDEQQGFT